MLVHELWAMGAAPVAVTAAAIGMRSNLCEGQARRDLPLAHEG